MAVSPIYIIPPHQFTLTPRETLQRAARRPHETQAAAAGLNEPLPIPYGQNRVGGRVMRPVPYGDDLLWPFIISRGEIDAVETIYFGGAVFDPSFVHSHLGIAAPPVEPWLQSAWAIQGTNYADTLPNVAWAVLRIPATATALNFEVVVTFRGRKLYDPRTGLTVYSANPVLALADFIASTAFGKGETVDWTTVATCANVADQSVGGKARRSFGLMIDTVRPLDDWENVLRAYAGVFLVREGGVVRFVPDATASSVFTFTNAAGSSNYLRDSIRARQRARRNTPTVVTVRWTDTTVTPWTERSWTEKAPGVDAGTEQWRESDVPMPGIQDAGQARREAIRRLNEFIATDLEVELIGTGNAVNLRRGDVVALTDSGGFTAKLFRLVAHRPGPEPGLWRETLVEYDPAVYSDAVATGPTTPDTTFPSPTAAPPPTGLALSEEVFQIQTGRYGSRLRATWTAPASFPFILGYNVVWTDGTTIVDSGFPLAGDTTHVTKALPENVTYTVAVSVITLTGDESAAITGSYTNNGKQAKPGDVPAFSGYEVGGEVRLEWTPAVDLDLTAHEIRYGTTGGSWGTATLVDRVATPAVRYSTKTIPPGTWRFWIKGLDSVRTAAFPFGQESVNAVSTDIDVTSDANAFIAASYQFVSPTVVRMTLRNATGTWVPGAEYVTDVGGTWAATFPAALSTYTSPLLTYHAATPNGFWTEVYDIGVAVTGDWFASMTYEVLSGTVALSLDLNETGPEAAKTITGATNATPIVITSTAHGYANGNEVEQSGVVGNTAANGRFIVKNPTANTYELTDMLGNNVAGNGAYTSGGTAKRWKWTAYASLNAKTTARFVRLSIRSNDGGTLRVTNPGTFRVQVITRRDGGIITAAASGPTVFEFSQTFNRAVKALVSAIGSAGEYGEPDRIEVSQGRGIGSARFIRLNGSTQYVDMGDQGVHSQTTGAADKDFTLEAWARRDLAAVGTAGVIAGRSNNGVVGEYVSFINASERPSFFVIDDTAGGRKEFVANVQVQPEVWHHIAWAYTASTQTAQCYLDGVAVASTLTVIGTYTRMRDTTITFRVGSQLGSAFFGGGIDEVRLWNVARTAAQIVGSKDSIVTTHANLISRWGFDEVAGTTAADTAGGFTGTVNGTPAGSFLFRPYNGLDVYRFNAAGSQVSGPVSVHFEGV